MQHGFCGKSSCEYQLLGFIDDIANYMQRGAQTKVIVMDFSKAFDKISYHLLMHKLYRYGVQGNS